MKTSIRLIALSLTVASIAKAAPFLAVGDGAELFLTGALGVRSDNNIYMGATKVSDVVFDVNPGVDLVFGNGSATKGHISLVANISRYSQNSGNNTELAAINFSSNYDDGKSKLAVTAGYSELNQNTVDTLLVTTSTGVM